MTSMGNLMLEERNWEDWDFKVLNYARQRGVERYLLQPRDQLSAEDQNSGMQARLLAWIAPHVNRVNFPHIKTYSTGRELYVAAKEWGKEQARKYGTKALHELSTLKLGTLSVEKYLAAADKIRSDLELADRPISDELFAQHLLQHGLPPAYAMLQMFVRDKPLDELRARLLELEFQLGVSRGQLPAPRPSTTSNHVSGCFTCGQPGHIAAQCPNRVQRHQQPRPQHQPQPGRGRGRQQQGGGRGRGREAGAGAP